MKKITLSIIAVIMCLTAVKHTSIENFFTHKRYYPIFVALGLAHKQYRLYKPDHFYQVFSQEGFDFTSTNRKIIHDSLDKIKNNHAKINSIPLITHHIYFTAPGSSAKLTQYHIENLKITFNKLNALGGDWQHNIWTNNPDLFPEDLKAMANVRSIDEFADNQFYDHIIKSIAKGNESKAYLAEGSDIARLLVMQKFGGIYTDMDYEIYNPKALLDLMHRFDFIAGRDQANILRFYGNSFLLAKPNHLVLNDALFLLQRNLTLAPDAPDYIRYPASELGRIYSNGPPLITFAYFRKNNQHDNKDVVLPSWMVYNTDFIRFKNKGCDLSKISQEDLLKSEKDLPQLIAEFTANAKTTKPFDGEIALEDKNIFYDYQYNQGFSIIGADMFCGTWADKQFPRIFYWNIPFLNYSLRHPEP